MGADEPTLADLVEVLRAEQRRRWQAGEQVATETYFVQHPELVGDITCALKMIYNEVLLREADGEGPHLDEYVRRFPGLTDQLAPLFDVHRALESDGLLVAAGGDPPLDKVPTRSDPPGGGAWPTIAGHEILEELGRGGMGVVYKARQIGLNRLVALKVILDGNHANPSQLARFRAEAEAVAHLQHPNIVQIHHVAEQDGRPYFSLEYVDGGNLAQALKGDPQPARLAADLIRTLALAIHAAHQRGIVHRDLKPANILLQRQDRDGNLLTQETQGVAAFALQSSFFLPKITDFGLAKQLDADLGQTSSGAIIGTPSYMAPEQADGQSRDIGAAADVYALGAILYELLSGRPPFKAETRSDTLRQVLSEEPLSLSRFHLKVPRDLDTICLKCLQKEPRKRYPTALELAEELKRFLSDQPIQARRTPVVEQAWRWCRRNPLAAALAAMLAGLVMLVVAGSVLSALQLNAEAHRAAASEHEATYRLFRSRIAEARAIRFSGRMGQRWAALEALKEAVDLGRALDVDADQILTLRNEALACLALVDIKIDKEWNGSPPGCNGLAFSAHYDIYAQSWADGTIRLRRVADDGEIASLQCSVPPGLNRRVEMLFSPADRFLCAWFRDAAAKLPLWVWDLKRIGRTPVYVEDVLGYCGFAADESRLALALPGKTVGIYDLGSAQEIARLATEVNPFFLAFDPDGRRLALACEQPPQLQIHDAADGRLLRRIVHPQGVQGLAWTPDGRTLASGCMDQRIYFWDASTGERQAELRGHSWEVCQLSFSHTGDLLMSASYDHTLRLWDAGLKKSLVTVPNARLARFSRDDRFAGAIVHGNTVGVCGVLHSPEFKVHDTQQGDIWTFDFHPNGRLLASTGENNVCLMDLEAGKELAVLPNTARYSALFHPPSQSLLTFGRGTLSRWPLRAVSHEEGTFVPAGPPEELLVVNPKRDSWGRLCWRGPGWKSLVISETGRGMRVVELDNPARETWHWDFPGVNFIAASPDGRWIAGGTWDGTGVRVWDAQQGGLANEWSCGDAVVAFSPDGQWLAITPAAYAARGAECCCRRVGTWEPGNQLSVDRSNAPADMAYSPNGNLLAVAHTMTEIVLLAPKDFRELGRLQAREPLLIHCSKFSPDGSRLVVGLGKGIIGVWDLRLLWRELADMHLDDGLPPVCDVLGLSNG
jgi:serine/threonine protein kinase/WD40 repeat protein